MSLFSDPYSWAFGALTVATLVVLIAIGVTQPPMWVLGIIIGSVVWFIGLALWIGFSAVPLYKKSRETTYDNL